MDTTYLLLVGSAASVAFFHALAPDHWMPFVMIGRAQRWSRARLIWVSFLGSLGHIGSSLVLGAAGILLGVALVSLEGFEASRGQGALLLLIGFGVAYAVWGLKHAREHHHHHHALELDEDRRKTISVWSLVAIIVLGPCEPLIPLLFLATKYGWDGLVLTTAVFSLTTMAMMVGLSLFAYLGIERLRLHAFDRYVHAISGALIALTGVLVLVLGL
jgi:nickel/cobalt exporter